MPAPVSKSAKSVSNSAKSAPKAPPTRTEPQADKGNTHRGRERRPSDKVAAQRKWLIRLYSFFNYFLKINSFGATRG
jgi:hypothetical protein